MWIASSCLIQAPSCLTLTGTCLSSGSHHRTDRTKEDLVSWRQQSLVCLWPTFLLIIWDKFSRALSFPPFPGSQRKQARDRMWVKFLWQKKKTDKLNTLRNMNKRQSYGREQGEGVTGSREHPPLSSKPSFHLLRDPQAWGAAPWIQV